MPISVLILVIVCSALALIAILAKPNHSSEEMDGYLVYLLIDLMVENAGGFSIEQRVVAVDSKDLPDYVRDNPSGDESTTWIKDELLPKMRRDPSRRVDKISNVVEIRYMETIKFE